MQVFFASGVEIDRCFFCGGIWLDGGELERTVGHPLEVQLQEGDTHRRCAGCRTTMVPALVREVEIELCGTCHGVYLDDSELQLLAERPLTLERLNAQPAREILGRCRGCGSEVPLDEGATTKSGFSCRNCYGMLDATPSTVAPTGSDGPFIRRYGLGARYWSREHELISRAWELLR